MSKLQMRRLRIKFALGCESKRVIQSNPIQSQRALEQNNTNDRHYDDVDDGGIRWGSGWRVGAKAGETFWIPQQTRTIIYCVMNATNARCGLKNQVDVGNTQQCGINIRKILKPQCFCFKKKFPILYSFLEDVCY